MGRGEYTAWGKETVAVGLAGWARRIEKEITAKKGTRNSLRVIDLTPRTPIVVSYLDNVR
jgi:hypothetical protein